MAEPSESGADRVQARAEDWLSSGGLRHTKQRLAIARILVGDGRNRHVTAENVHESTGTQDVSVSLATVYNTLRAFSDAGLVNEITVDGSGSYFDTRVDDHPHYYWEESSRLTDAPNDAIELARAPVVPDGAELARVDVVIRLREKSR